MGRLLFCLVLWIVPLFAVSAKDNNSPDPQEFGRICNDVYSKFPSICRSLIPPVLVEEPKTEPNWSAPNCRMPGNHDEADLCEQRNMSKHAKISVWVAYLQAVLSALGFGALLVTIRLTAKSTEAAILAAKAAEEAVSSERAWIVPDIQSIKYDTVFNAYYNGKLFKNTIAIHIPFVNKGRSPAINVGAACAYVINPKYQSSIPIFDLKIPDETGAGIAGPDVAFWGNRVFIDDEDYMKLMRREAVIFVYGKVAYDDIFGQKNHITEVCFHMYYAGDIVEGGVTKPNWAPSQVGPQNTAS